MDPWETLGVRRGASEQEVRSAFRAWVRSTHPDHGGDPAQFRPIVEAYRQLVDWRDDLAPEQGPEIDEDGWPLTLPPPTLPSVPSTWRANAAPVLQVCTSVLRVVLLLVGTYVAAVVAVTVVAGLAAWLLEMLLRALTPG